MSAGADCRPRIGLVGLGDLGEPVALRVLDAGFQLMVWARRPARADHMRGMGATSAPDLPALARASDLVQILVTDADAVADVIDGLAPGLSPGTTILIHATIGPAACRRVAKAVHDRGGQLLDAPLSGGPAAARSGALTAYAGGERDVLDRCRPLLSSFAKTIVPLGEIGTGQTAKLVNNAVLVANLAICEAAALAGEGLGLRRDALDAVLASGSGYSFAQSLYRLGATDLVRYLPVLRKDIALYRCEILSLDAERSREALMVAQLATHFLEELERKAGFSK